MSLDGASWTLTMPLRRWQEEALRKWQQEDRGVAAVVTGGGKTFLAYACMLDLRRRRPDLSVIIIVPTVALLDQWAVGLTEDLGVAQDEIALFGGGRTTPEPRHVSVMVVNTARKLAPSISRKRPVFLIVDECHRSASQENARALEGPHIATLGLSATPERDFDDLFSRVIVPALGPVIYRYDYNEARADHVISPFQLINVRVPLKEEEKELYDRKTRQLWPLFKRRDRGEDLDQRLHRLLRERARVSNAAAMRLPAAIKIIETHQRERAIVFHEQIDIADAIAYSLANRNHRVATYHSGLGNAIRYDNLRMFRRGQIDVLVTCRALDEGINVPNASVAIIVASTSSTRQRIQRLGRVLRPAPCKDRAIIYTIYASEPEAERLRQEEQGLDGAEEIRWQSWGR